MPIGDLDQERTVRKEPTPTKPKPAPEQNEREAWWQTYRSGSFC